MQMTEIQIVSGSQEEVSAVIEGECDLLVPRKLLTQLDRGIAPNGNHDLAQRSKRAFHGRVLLAGPDNTLTFA